MTNTISRRTFAAMALGTGAMLAAGVRPAPRRRAGNAFAWTTLRDGQAWATGNQSTGGNVLLVKSKDQTLMVDSKFAGIAPLLKVEAESSDRAGQPVTTFVNTHHHGDHTGGNAACASADTYAHAAAAWRISKQFDSYQQQLNGAEDSIEKLADGDAAQALQLLAEVRSRMDAHKVDVFVPKNTINHYPASLLVGELQVDLYHFGPGHTDNDVVVHIPQLRILHAGDLLFNGRHPYFDPNGGVSAAGWIRSVRHARELCDADTTVVPGHGPVADRAALERQIDYLENLIEHVSKAIKEGKSKEETTGMTWPFMEGLGAEQIRGRAISAVYDELSR